MFSLSWFDNNSTLGISLPGNPVGAFFGGNLSIFWGRSSILLPRIFDDALDRKVMRNVRISFDFLAILKGNSFLAQWGIIVLYSIRLSSAFFTSSWSNLSDTTQATSEWSTNNICCLWWCCHPLILCNKFTNFYTSHCVIEEIVEVYTPRSYC